MKKVLAVLLLLLPLSLPLVAHANDSPYDCDHGNSNQPCRPDPQPSHGKDCLPHGNRGGVNEDHCSTVPTTTLPVRGTIPTTNGPVNNPSSPTSTSVPGGSVVPPLSPALTSLPATGSNTGGWLVLAGILLALGGPIVYGVRK